MASVSTSRAGAALGLAGVLAAGGAAAQPASNPPSTELAPVTVIGRPPPAAAIGGFGDIPLARTPLQATVVDSEQLRDQGARRLSDLTASDPAVSDAYNTEGYWDYLTVRGFLLDNRFNYRRDGLPINAETSIPLDNKARIEVLKGTSGMQAGTSAPGGLVNFIVKRPTDAPLRSVFVEWRERGSVLGAVDLSQRFGSGGAFGLRLNAAAAHLDPKVRSARGDRELIALAGDWRLSNETLLEAEVEHSRRSQPSVPGFSLLGDRVPAPVDPRINLNNQPWSLPVVLDATTASLRFTQRLTQDLRFVAHAATQRLKSDDRIAFPFGCTDPNPPPDGTYYPDRYCPNGTFDLYDFRSDDERRRTDAIDVSLAGKARTGPVSHAFSGGLQYTTFKSRFERQANNFVGTGSVEGTLVTPSDPSLTDENTNRDEHSTELYLRDAIAVGERATLWLGLRHTRLSRESVRTDGSRATDYSQSFTTPWIAASYEVVRGSLVYASWGRGVESEVAPNRDRYTNAGQALPALKSRQLEVGIKGASDRVEWNVAAFDVVRPYFADIGACDLPGTCTRRVDGSFRHRGIEADVGVSQGPWTVRAGAQWLRARREGASNAADDGLEPTNVPARTLKLLATYAVPTLPALGLQAGVVHESRRMVLPDNSASIPGWTRVDVGARYESKLAGAPVTWRAGIDNLFDRRAWRESPYQFGHAYLFPLAARTLRISAQVEL